MAKGKKEYVGGCQTLLDLKPGTMVLTVDGKIFVRVKDRIDLHVEGEFLRISTGELIHGSRIVEGGKKFSILSTPK